MNDGNIGGTTNCWRRCISPNFSALAPATWRYSPRSAAPHPCSTTERHQGKEYVSFWNHDAEMSESNDSRIEARECIRNANRCDDSQNRWAWLVLAKSWLLLADGQEIAESGFEASAQELTAEPRAAR
jgi:hypothetical protein